MGDTRSRDRENVDLVKALLERFIASGELSWDLMHEDIEVYDHDVMDAGEYRGHLAFARWLENWDAAWSEFSIEPEEFLDAGERVVFVFRMKATGRGSGVVVERQDVDAVVARGTLDFEWLPATARIVEGGGYRGRAGFESYLVEIDSTWEELRAVPTEFRDLGEQVLVLGRMEGRGTGGGVPVDAPLGMVFDFRGGKVSRARTYLD